MGVFLIQSRIENKSGCQLCANSRYNGGIAQEDPPEYFLISYCIRFCTHASRSKMQVPFTFPQFWSPYISDTIKLLMHLWSCECPNRVCHTFFSDLSHAIYDIRIGSKLTQTRSIFLKYVTAPRENCWIKGENQGKVWAEIVFRNRPKYRNLCPILYIRNLNFRKLNIQ